VENLGKANFNATILSTDNDGSKPWRMWNVSTIWENW
jgi:hypothetical protein